MSRYLINVVKWKQCAIGGSLVGEEVRLYDFVTIFWCNSNSSLTS